MTTDRKIFTAAGAACILGVMAAIMAIAFIPVLGLPPVWFFPFAAFALICAWIGSAIASMLKNNPKL